MTEVKSDIKERFKPDELEKLLNAYWLATDYGLMAQAVKTTVKAYHHGWPIFLVQHEPGHVAPVAKTLSALGIEHEVRTLKPTERRDAHSVRPRKLGANALKIGLPDMADRIDDFELLVPYFFDRRIGKLSAKSQVNVSAVEGVFLLLLRCLLKQNRRKIHTPHGDKPGVLKMGDIIENSIAYALDGVASSAPSVLPPYFARPYYEELQKLPRVAGMYLGLSYFETLADAVAHLPLKNDHLINTCANVAVKRQDEVRRAFVEGPTFSSASKRAPVRHFPWLKRRVLFKIQSVGLAARNLAHHVREGNKPIDEKVRGCLEMRLRRRSETSIRKELGFHNKDEYDAWLADNYIDITSRTRDNILKKWEEAKESLFRDQEISETKSVEPTEISDGSEAIRQTKADKSAYSGQLKLENEGRIVICAQGRLSFTKTQAKIVAIYYKNYTEGNSFLLEQNVLETAKESGARFSDLFRSRWKNFKTLFENHETEKDLWRFKSSL